MSATKKKPAKAKKTPPKATPPKAAKKPAAKKKPEPKKPAAPKKPEIKMPVPKVEKKSIPTPKPAPAAAEKPAKAPASIAPKLKAAKPLEDELPLDVEEKEELADEEKRDLAKALITDDDGLETTFVPTDTSERYLLVVDEESQRRTETVTIISQILPNAVVEVADDPEEALEMMQDCEFDTFVVNFLMPGYSASPFVKAVANHPEHPLLIGFAADKISDALDPKKGLKIIPLKRLFDLDASAAADGAEGEGA